MKISINIISLGRESIYKTLESLVSQETNFDIEINIILQWNLDEDKINQLMKKADISVYEYERWLWFGYYRNQAIERSTGEILARIDDDEWTADNNWIDTITGPIRDWAYKVVTAGTQIELGKWYIADCISYLWYPWWSVIWFNKMRTVDSQWVTKHLCSGNFAFDKSVLKIVWWFQESLKSWAEDVAFGTMLSNNWIDIFWEPNATIYHVHREGIVNFCKRHFLRGKSAAQYLMLWQKKMVSWGHWKDKLVSIKYILFWKFFSGYMPWIWFLFWLQYVSMILWFLLVRFK